MCQTLVVVVVVEKQVVLTICQTLVVVVEVAEKGRSYNLSNSSSSSSSRKRSFLQSVKL